MSSGRPQNPDFLLARKKRDADLALAGQVAGALPRGLLVVVGAVALAAVDEPEELHVRHGAAEFEVDLVSQPCIR